LLLLAVLRLLLLIALHRMKLGIKLVERLGEHLALQLFERGGEQRRCGLAGGGFGGFRSLRGAGLALLRSLRIRHGIGLCGFGLLARLLQLTAGLRDLLRGFLVAQTLLMAGDTREIVRRLLLRHAVLHGLLRFLGHGLFGLLRGVFGGFSQRLLHGRIFRQLLLQCFKHGLRILLCVLAPFRRVPWRAHRLHPAAPARRVPAPSAASRLVRLGELLALLHLLHVLGELLQSLRRLLLRIGGGLEILRLRLALRGLRGLLQILRDLRRLLLHLREGDIGGSGQLCFGLLRQIGGVGLLPQRGLKRGHLLRVLRRLPGAAPALFLRLHRRASQPSHRSRRSAFPFASW
jgi:hypothetical protein